MEGNESSLIWNGSTESDETADRLGTENEDVRVHEWRVQQLLRIGLPRALADAFAPLVDWHEVAALVERGCAPELAVEIVR